MLNDFYRDKTLNNDHGVELPQFDKHDVLSELKSIHIIPDEVKTVLKSLSLGTVSGADEIYNRALREVAREISVLLCSLFSRSLQSGEFPNTWKMSYMSLIAKGSHRASPSNYRPISLLCSPENCFERVVFKHLYTHFHENLSSHLSELITVNQLTCSKIFSQFLATKA